LRFFCCFFFFQAEDGIRDFHVTGVQTCALPICAASSARICLLPLSKTPACWMPVRFVDRAVGRAAPAEFNSALRQARRCNARAGPRAAWRPGCQPPRGSVVPMARIERATSPLPRECSTTEPHGPEPKNAARIQPCGIHPGAGEGNRTLVVSLEGFCSTIELHPPVPDPCDQPRTQAWRRTPRGPVLCPFLLHASGFL